MRLGVTSSSRRGVCPHPLPPSSTRGAGEHIHHDRGELAPLALDGRGAGGEGAPTPLALDGRGAGGEGAPTPLALDGRGAGGEGAPTPLALDGRGAAWRSRTGLGEQERVRLRQRRGGEGASRHLLAALGLALAALAGLRPQVGHGAAWRPSGLSSSPVYALTADPSAPGVLYAALLPGGAVPSGLRKTVDSGRTWLETMRGLPRGFEPTALAIAPQDGRTVLVAGVDGLYRSTAAGASWTEVRVPLPPITALLIDREHPGTIIAGTELHGNFRSTDDGLTWFEANGGLLRDHYGTIPGAVALAQHPKNPQIIYMGANGFDGFYRSLDGGQTWQVANSGLPGRSVRGLVVDPGAPDTIYAVTEKGLARSTDAGATWQALETLPRPVRALAAWPGATTPMLAAAAGEGVWELSLFPTLPASPLPAGRDRQY